ncbi:MAG: hypothetical protein K6E91_01270 [Butyrivibrio sp.]|nr:hypothetical protein [Butyrivibrio sp.]
MNSLKKWFENYIHQPNFRLRFIIMMIGVFFMGFWLSFLIRCNLGTDPCSFMNLTVSRKLGILFGTWQLLLNSLLLVIVLIFGRNYIGFGTIANMVFIGYIADFFGWVWDRFIPVSFFTQLPSRAIIFAISFSMFVFSASLYMNADMGVAPYDAIPLMIKKYILRDTPFAAIRICFDFSAVIIGLLCGGKPNLGILLMSLFLGPMITAVGKFLKVKVFHLA